MDQNAAQPSQPDTSPTHEVNPATTNQEAVHAQKPKKDIPWLKILVFGLIIVITIAAFSLIAYLMMGGQKTTDEPEDIRAKTPATQEVDPYTNWNTYQGDGFTFKYPDDWSQIDDSEIIRKNIINEASPSAQPIGSFDLVVNVPLAEKSKEEIIADTIFGQWSETAEEIEINKYNALKIKGIGGVGNSVYNVGFAIEKDPNTSLVISGYTLNEELWEELEEELLTILSTFKFTGSEISVDKSNWETYTSTNKQFSFKYPEEFTFAYISFDTDGNFYENAPHFFKNQNEANKAVNCYTNEQDTRNEPEPCDRGWFDVTDVTNFQESAKQQIQSRKSSGNSPLLYEYIDENGRVWDVFGPAGGPGGSQTNAETVINSKTYQVQMHIWDKFIEEINEGEFEKQNIFVEHILDTFNFSY